MTKQKERALRNVVVCPQSMDTSSETPPALPEPRALLPVKRFYAHSPFYPLPIYLFFVGFALVLLSPAITHSDYIGDGPVSGVVAIAFAAVLVLSTLLCLIPSCIVLGADGVERRWLCLHRFVPFRAAKRFHIRYGLHPCLDLHDGRRQARICAWRSSALPSRRSKRMPSKLY